MKVDSGIAQWRGGVEVRDEQPDLGPANYLFEAVTTVFSATLQVMIGDYKHFNLESYEILREEFRKFYLWNEGFSTSSGDLDQILSSSKNLKATVLNLMVSWVNAVLRSEYRLHTPGCPLSLSRCCISDILFCSP